MNRVIFMDNKKAAIIVVIMVLLIFLLAAIMGISGAIPFLGGALSLIVALILGAAVIIIFIYIIKRSKK